MIKCDECGKDISDKAEFCPNCGNPITSNEVFHEPETVTIQRTYKKWKFVHVVSVLVFIIGILMVSGGEAMQAFGILFILSGIIGVVVARLGAWWTTG